MANFQEESPLGFEWDENKRRAVLAERRIDFRDAVRIFDGPVLETLSRHPAETRWVAMVYTVRDGRRRIITARRARTHERREYHAYVLGGGESP